MLLGFRPGLDAVPALAAILVVTVSSCTGFGMLLGSIGLRAKDFFFAANLAYFLMLLFCGVNIPLVGAARLDERDRTLPAADPWDRRRARGRGGCAARRRLGARLDRGRDRASRTRPPASSLFRILERESRRSAVLDAY